MHYLSLFLACLSLTLSLQAAGPGSTNDFKGKRVLYIGVDGCRADAVQAVMGRGLAPNMQALAKAEQGLLSLTAYAGGELGSATHQATVSGPGWSSLLTGVWLNRHGVRDNRFLGARFQSYPHFMRRIKEVQPQAWCGSLANWAPIHEFIADGSRVAGAEFLDLKFTPPPDEDGHPISPVTDIAIRDAAANALRAQHPDVLFVYFGSVDEFGHGLLDERGSFSPENALYLNAISHVDAHIGELLRALRARPSYAEEDWLILITTDHGGHGTSHGSDQPVDRNIWLLAHGSGLDRTALLSQPVPQTALVPMIYAHLGVQARPEWNPAPAQPDADAAGTKSGEAQPKR